MRLHALVLTAALLTSVAEAEVIRVGPDGRFLRVADAAEVARDGDTIEIVAGEYHADAAVWSQKKLTIRGVGGRPVLIADGASAEGKAIWVVRGDDTRIDNIEFRGARVRDGNGAGVRLERGRLHVRDCVFTDNQIGILTGNHAEIELTVENSVFAQAPVQSHSLPHLLYAGRIARLEIVGSRFHQGYRGHLLKSRAKQNFINYNLIYDGPGGGASYEIDLPNGGLSFLIGNVIGQSDTTQNPVVVAFGAEGNAWPVSALYLSHNTLLSARSFGAWFLRAWSERLPPDAEIKAVNNLTVGLGAFSLAAPGDFHGNVPVLPFMLGGPDILDFTLSADSMLDRFTSEPGTGSGYSLAPAAEFRFPVGTAPLSPSPPRWRPGAFQSTGFAR